MCLALAVTSLGAAPIYHRVYEGQATLISETVTCSETVAIDDTGTFVGGGSSGCAAGPVTFGSLVYRGPIFDLPPRSVILSAELHQWGYFNIAPLAHMYSVEPLDPTKPFSGASIWLRRIQYIPAVCCDARAALFEFTGRDTLHPSFDGVDTDYAEEFLIALPWKAGEALPLTVSEAQLVEFQAIYGSSWDIPGLNSVTTVTDTFALTDSAGFYSLDITYEAPVPEPATASLFVVGAAALLLLRRVRRTRLP